ncbi:MAG TPA: DUF2752 domain-containing protein [Phycisphaerae bacterium]|nr:DUF2752 domain-containing protein [Phycisphaerae bacterium]
MQSEGVEEAVLLQPARFVRRRAGWGLRLRGAALFVPAFGVLTVACFLRPREAGYGTHEQLGLPPCAFLARTGYPCASCGLTTSFAAMAHGKVVQAFLVHPLGVVLFAGTLLVGLAGLGEAVTGRDVLPLLRPGVWWAMVIAVGLLGGWAFKIAWGLATGVLPAR